MSILFEMTSDINYRENNGEHKTTNSLVLLTGWIRVFRDTLNPAPPTSSSLASLSMRACRHVYLFEGGGGGIRTPHSDASETLSNRISN